MKKGDKVKIHYTGKLNDGTIFDTSEKGGPLEFTIGENQVIPGFENAVKEMKVNEEKTIKIKPEDAYGQKNEKLVMDVPRDKFPRDLKIEAGGQVMLKSPQGHKVLAFVKVVKGDKVFIDLNPPLAGKELTFKLKLVSVN